MYREALVKFKVSQLIENESKYDFPEFLLLVRKLHNLNRRVVAKDTGISHTHLFYLETGFFMKPPKTEIYLILAQYYGIPEELLKAKVLKYISEDKNRWSGKDAISKGKGCKDQEGIQRECEA